jgi:hypothetical protein
LCRVVEALAFKWILLGRNAQVLEDLYQKSARVLLDATRTHDEALALLIERMPSEDEVIAGLHVSDSVHLQKYALRRIEESTGGQILSWDDAITLEHLAPQNPMVNSAYWHAATQTDGALGDDDPTYEDFVRNWGNLTLLEHKLNASIQNSPWPRKRDGDPASNLKGLKSSTMNVNSVLKSLPEWTNIQIASRQDWLIRCVRELLGSNWIETGETHVQMWSAP